jgi:hypothetical protein
LCHQNSSLRGEARCREKTQITGFYLTQLHRRVRRAAPPFPARLPPRERWLSPNLGHEPTRRHKRPACAGGFCWFSNSEILRFEISNLRSQISDSNHRLPTPDFPHTFAARLGGSLCDKSALMRFSLLQSRPERAPPPFSSEHLCLARHQLTPCHRLSPSADVSSLCPLHLCSYLHFETRTPHFPSPPFHASS